MAEKPAAEKADAKKADAGKKKSPGMEKLVKNHFWILGGLALLVAAIVWYLGAGALDAVYAKDQQTNDRAFSTVNSLKAKSGPNSPPNQRYAGKVHVRRQALTDEVLKAWEDLYNRQTGLFTVNPKVEIFRQFVLMEPDDRKALLEKNSGLAANVAGAIQTYHNNQVLEEDFEKLFEPLNLRRARGRNVFGRAVGGAAPPEGAAPEGILVWAASPSPLGLTQRYDTVNAPSLDRISVTYEDLWTFRSLFGVITKINEKPGDYWLAVMNGETPSTAANVDQANVPIKRIDYCDLAQYAMSAAVNDAGNVQIATGEAAADPNAAFGAGGMDNAGSAFSVGTSGNEGEDKRLLTDRYLDGRNMPVSDPSNPPYTEFRQMFVQMTVLMDQRLIPVLIAQCANAPIPIETRQVRINLNEVDRIRKVNAEDAAAQVQKVEQSPHDAVVTLRGIVYIYTKNDPKIDPEEDAAAAEKRKLGEGADPNPADRDFGVPKRGAAAEQPTF